MMHYASQGVRNATRKGSNVLVHHGGHNGPGGSTTANTTSRSLHISNILLAAARAAHPPVPHINSLEAIRPRNPSHKLFSASKNFLQRIFTHLSAPGLRAPQYLAQVQQLGTRSLHGASARATSIQGGLSAAARNSIRNNALQRQANLFLPRAPAPVPPRCGGVAQVGLGAARNFSTGRPIFQQLAENVPIAGRALYQVDWDLETQKEQAKMRAMIKSRSNVRKSKEMLKPSEKAGKPSTNQSTPKEATPEVNQATVEHELNHYFPQAQATSVTTYLLIPLAPTPSARMPLQLEPETSMREPGLLPPLSYLGAMHADHSTHALRVSTLFTRLDQANVWERGDVTCTAYSQGLGHQFEAIKDADGMISVEGACTVLQVEFVGWTKAAVRGVLGESGSGWCVLEELDDDGMTNVDSLASEMIMEDHSPGYQTADIPELYGLGMPNLHDPADSFVLPTLDFSSSFATSVSGSSTPSSQSAFTSIPDGMEMDPWTEVYPSSPSGSSESSLSDYSDLIIEPPSINGYFGQRHGFGPGVGFSADAAGRFDEPRESMFL